MRLALLALLVLLVLSIGTGSASAISGMSGEGSAGIAQYPLGSTPNTPVTVGQQQTPPTEQGDVLEEEETGVTPDEGQPIPTEDEVGGRVEAQPEQQLAAGGDGGLPFTGLALMAMLLAGTGLLTAGLVLRRRTGVSAA